MEPIIGIDLGTTNSVVAVVQDGKPHVISEDGEAILPSVVGLDEQGRLLVGRPARNQFVLAPERTVRSIKRQMGEEVTVRLGDQQYSPQEISAIILRTLKQRAEKHLGRPVSKAVITVPAFFSEIQREATREAGQLAGLEVVRIINEPTAASLAYEPHPTDLERLLVYDLGGGTFDVSIVQIEQGVVEVLASHGDTHLGGDDFDQLLLEWVADEFAGKKGRGLDLRELPRAKSRLLHAVEAAKIGLSDEPVVELTEEFIAEKEGLPLHLRREIERIDYEELIEPLLSKTLVCLDEALDDAKLNARQIDKVVLVGGASRTPMVHRLLHERLGQPLHHEVHPDLCVAIGAAIQGALIAGLDVGPVLVDITPHTLGIQCVGVLHGFETDRCFAPIIERNSPLPVSRSEMFSTVFDGQDKALISVYQGEEDDVTFNEAVGEFLLDGLADAERGNQIQVRFTLDQDGILKVTATERATGLEKQLVVDNALERFRSRSREEATARLAGMFGSEPAAEARAETVADERSLPPELVEAVSRAEELVSRAGHLRDRAAPDDARELDELVAKLQAAIDSRAADEIETACEELDDLVFYLHDSVAQ